MKTLLIFLCAFTLLTTGPSRAQNGGSVSLDFFYENLDPYGDWREVGDYGYCWQPRDVNPGWSPYSDGRWLYSDVGWTWDSDEPYSWAVYHYGRWANVASIGWIWVPGTEWGPGWVSWRNNSQYTGWAPLPPEARFQVSIGFSGWVDDYYDIGPDNYRFVQNRHFASRNLGSVFIDQSRNTTIINQTTNITNIRYENNSIHNGGPRYDNISRLTSDPIPRYNLQRRQDFDRDSPRHSPDHLRSRLDGDSLSVFAPPLTTRQPSSGPGRHSEKIDNARINRGWDRSGSPDEIAALRRQMKSPVDIPKDLPPPPRLDRKPDRPKDPSPTTDADRPPGPRDPAAKGKPGKPNPPVLDTPPKGRPNPEAEKGKPQKRPPPNTRPTEKPAPDPKVRTPESPKPDSQRPDMKKPETRKPESKKPETRKPDPQRPDIKKPTARMPDPKIPQTKKPEARKPESNPPQAKKPAAKHPETKRPEMKRPEPQQPAPKKPEARPEPQKPKKPQAKPPQQQKPEASRPAPQPRPPTAPRPPPGKGKDGGKPDKKKSEEERK